MHSPRLKKLCWTLPGLCRICRGGSNDCKWSLVKGGSPNPIQSAKARQGKKLCPHTDNSSLMVLQGLGAHVCLLDRGVVRVHLGLRAEAHERHAIVQRLGVDRGAGHAREVQADLLDERPFVVHAPLREVLPTLALRVLLHERLHQAGPARVAAGRWPVGRRPHVRAREDIGHRALVAVEVVAAADAVRDVDADVRKGPHLGEDGLPQRLLPDDPAAPRARVHILLVEVLVNGGVNVAAQVPDLVGTPDHEGASVERLRPGGDRQLRYQARVVERRRGQVGHRHLRGGHRHGVGRREAQGGRRLGGVAGEQHGGDHSGGRAKNDASHQGKRHRHPMEEEMLPPAPLAELLEPARDARQLRRAAEGGRHAVIRLGRHGRGGVLTRGRKVDPPSLLYRGCAAPSP
mmetsp:Transcript_98874/g.308085  ORF Transcript_98874/g.308085 Transcript_98874/m.308085 type:complete len:403 (-) Transcript_98874:163-1371(-)